VARRIEGPGGFTRQGGWETEGLRDAQLHGLRSPGSLIEIVSAFEAEAISDRERVQRRLACSVGAGSTGAEVRSSAAWVAPVEEMKRVKPADRAIFGRVRESPGRSASEPGGSLWQAPCGGLYELQRAAQSAIRDEHG
jgi:hypothetical protein